MYRAAEIYNGQQMREQMLNKCDAGMQPLYTVFSYYLLYSLLHCAPEHELTLLQVVLCSSCIINQYVLVDKLLLQSS
jgi:hypothetical protein